MILITNLKMPALCGVTIHITPQGRVYNEDTGCDIGIAVELQEDIDLIDRNSVKKKNFAKFVSVSHRAKMITFVNH